MCVTPLEEWTVWRARSDAHPHRRWQPRTRPISFARLWLCFSDAALHTGADRLDAFALPRRCGGDDRPHCPGEGQMSSIPDTKGRTVKSAARLLDVQELLARQTRPVPTMTIARERG
jgi:hypothetical protein